MKRNNGALAEIEGSKYLSKVHLGESVEKYRLHPVGELQAKVNSCKGDQTKVTYLLAAEH